MWDSSGVVGEREAETAPVAASVEPYGDEWLLTLRPDFGWLGAAERVYPVTVDPTTAWGRRTRCGRSSPTACSQSGANWFGNPWQANHALYWRGFARYPLPNIAGHYVTDTALESATPREQRPASGHGWATRDHQSDLGQQLWLDVSSFTMCNGYTAASSSTIDSLDSHDRQHGSRGDYYNCSVSAVTGRPTRATATRVRQRARGRLLVLPGRDRRHRRDAASAGRRRRVRRRCRPPVQRRHRCSAVPVRVREDERREHRHWPIHQHRVRHRMGSPASSRCPRTCSSRTPSTAIGSRSRTRYDGWLGNDTKRLATNAAWYFTTNNTPVIPQATAFPADEEVVTTITPEFAVDYVADPDDATPVKYKFVVTTGSDGRTGAVVTSGWIDPAEHDAGARVTWTPVDGRVAGWRLLHLACLGRRRHRPGRAGVDRALQGRSTSRHIGSVAVRYRRTGDGEPRERQPGAELRLADGVDGGRPDGDELLVQLAGRPERQQGARGDVLQRAEPGPDHPRPRSRFDGREPVLAQTEPAVSIHPA